MDLLDAGINTFVCLRGEWSFETYKKKYPLIVEKSGKTVNFIHFRIDDFDVADDKFTVDFISELVNRVKNGQKLYIHCFGGHGRTGLISIQLFSALYGISSQEATKLVNSYHDQRIDCS